jgi:hypothetical protein
MFLPQGGKDPTKARETETWLCAAVYLCFSLTFIHYTFLLISSQVQLLLMICGSYSLQMLQTLHE